MADVFDVTSLVPLLHFQTSIVFASKCEPGLLVLPANHSNRRLDAALGREGDAYQNQMLELHSRAVRPAQERAPPLGVLLSVGFSSMEKLRRQEGDVTISVRSSRAM